MRIVIWSGVTLLVLLAFDHAMRMDRAHLCSNDATAYNECRR